MNRAYLSSAIEGLVSRVGYEFQLDDESCYPTTVCRYPAAFLSQPEFLSMEGRNRGKIAYKVTLRLAKQGAKLSPQERNALLASMEEQLVEVFVKLSQTERVAMVENLEIKPQSPIVDNHGAVAMVATAKVVTIF